MQRTLRREQKVVEDNLPKSIICDNLRNPRLNKTVLICYLLTAFYAVFGVVMGVTTKVRTVYAFFIYAVLFVISGLVIWKKGYLKMEGLRGKVPTKKD